MPSQPYTPPGGPLPNWWPVPKPVEPANYDLLIGTQLRFFPLTQLFTPNPDTSTDTLPVPVSGQQSPVTVLVSGIHWELTDVTATSVEYQAHFAGATAGSKRLSGAPFVAVSFHLPHLLAAGGSDAAPPQVESATTAWFTATDHLISPELSASSRSRVFEAFCAGVQQAQAACYARYFRTIAPHLLEAATGERRVFLQKNTRYLPYSYLCLGEMLPERPWPRQPAFPVDDMEEGPDFIYFLSPRAYLHLGLYPHLAQAYPKQEPQYPTEHELTLERLPLDWQAVAGTLGVSLDHIMDATVDTVTFAVRDAFFVVTYEASVQVYQPAHFVLPISTGFDNSYTIDLLRTCYYELYLERGQLQVRELPALRQERVSKTADHPEIENLVHVLDEKVRNLFSFLGDSLLPLGLSLALGGGLLGGAILLALCETLTKQLSAFYQAIRMQQLQAETATLHALQVAFADLLPFAVNQELRLSHFSLHSGLVVAGHFRQASRHYLLPGDCLLPGETLLGEGSTCLVFQPDGNLVLYSIRDHQHSSAYALWCSHGHGGYSTLGRGGDRVQFTQAGDLVMYKGLEVLWQAGMTQFAGNFVCVCAGHIRVAILYSSWWLPFTEDADGLDYATLFPADSFDRNYCDVQ